MQTSSSSSSQPRYAWGQGPAVLPHPRAVAETRQGRAARALALAKEAKAMAARALEGVRTLQQRTSLIVDGFHPHAIPALAEADPEADAATESDSESVSVAVPQQPTPAPQTRQQASGSQCLHRATRVLAHSVPLFAAIAMMLEGDRRENPALVITGAATLAAVAGQLVAAGLNQILDDVVARYCGAEPEAGQPAV